MCTIVLSQALQFIRPHAGPVPFPSWLRLSNVRNQAFGLKLILDYVALSRDAPHDKRDRSLFPQKDALENPMEYPRSGAFGTWIVIYYRLLRLMGDGDRLYLDANLAEPVSVSY